MMAPGCFPVFFSLRNTALFQICGEVPLAKLQLKRHLAKNYNKKKKMMMMMMMMMKKNGHAGGGRGTCWFRYTVVSGYKPWARSAGQRDNTGSWTQNGAFVS